MMLPSTNCPARKIATTARIHFQSGQNCAIATLVAIRQAGERADIRHEGHEAGERSDQQAEFNPTRVKARRNTAQGDAHAQLAAQKPGDRNIDLARQRPHGSRCRSGIQAVESLRPSHASRRSDRTSRPA